MFRKFITSALLIASVQMGSPLVFSQNGTEVVAIARGLSHPLGVEAHHLFPIYNSNTFDQNKDISNQWIIDQISYYDNNANASYRSYLQELIEGGPEGGLGMRQWLSDPANVAFWDNAVRENEGESGYARTIAQNSAFSTGSDDFRIAYGGIRRYDASTNKLTLNGTEFQGVSPAELVVKQLPPDTPRVQRFQQRARFGVVLHAQMSRFYTDYLAGRLSQNNVSDFNAAYVIAGGCALTTTDEDSPDIYSRYLQGMNLMSATLNKLGFSAQGAVTVPLVSESVLILLALSMLGSGLLIVKKAHKAHHPVTN